MAPNELSWNAASMVTPHRVAIDTPEASGIGIVTTTATVAADADIAQRRH